MSETLCSYPEQKKLSLAIPNGSLCEQVLRMLLLVGINVVRRGRQFTVPVDHPLVEEVVFMRPQHMTRELAKGRYDLAICGLDFYSEYSKSFKRFEDERDNAWCLSLGNFTGPKAERKSTRIVLFAHKDDQANDSWGVNGNRGGMITEYPSLTYDWFQELRDPGRPCLRHTHSGGIYKLQQSCGSTEAHVPRDYQYGVCLTESGATLAENNLKVLDVIMETYPVLLAPSSSVLSRPKEFFKKASAIASFTHLLLEARLLDPVFEQGKLAYKFED